MCIRAARWGKEVRDGIIKREEGRTGVNRAHVETRSGEGSITSGEERRSTKKRGERVQSCSSSLDLYNKEEPNKERRIPERNER